MISSAMNTYVKLIEIGLTVAIAADIALGFFVCKKQVPVKPLYSSAGKNEVKRAIAIRIAIYFIMIWALSDRNLGASDLGYIAVIYIAVLVKGFYDVKYGTEKNQGIPYDRER
jgi:hypothetical protein